VIDDPRTVSVMTNNTGAKVRPPQWWFLEQGCLGDGGHHAADRVVIPVTPASRHRIVPLSSAARFTERQSNEFVKFMRRLADAWIVDERAIAYAS